MLKENESKTYKSKEKTCLFFASDYHFEMITLPYINKSLQENKNVLIITENDLKDTAEKVISNINMKEEEKEKLKNINWSATKINEIIEDNRKVKAIEIPTNKKLIDNNERTIILVKGKQNYIRDINSKIKDLTNKEKIEIINCYDINEIQENVQEIIKNYDKVLSTSGIENLI